MPLCFDSGSYTASRTRQLNGYIVQDPNRKLGRGPEGDFCLERESRLSPCACLKTKKGACACVCDCVRRSHSRWKRHTCIHTPTHTHTQTLTYRLYCSSICVPLAVQFEGVGRCSVGPKQHAGWLFSDWSDNSGTQIHHWRPASSTHTITQIHTPLQLAVRLGPFTTLKANRETNRFRKSWNL